MLAALRADGTRLALLANACEARCRFEVTVHTLGPLPAALPSIKVLLTRGAKLQVTHAAEPANGKATFEQKLQLVATLYKDDKGALDAKVRDANV